MSHQKVCWSYRREIIWRLLAAGVGGYQVTSAACTLVALAIAVVTPTSRAEGVLIATLLGFLFYAVFAIWIFSSRSMARVWTSLAVGFCVSCVQILY